MHHNNQQPEAIQLELLKKTLHGWEPAFSADVSYSFTTEQLEHRFGISRQDLYKIKSKPYSWRSSFLIFLHLRKNKWQVYSLNPVPVGK
ncbi:hypothetical protein NIES4074_25700 [Cylindrospermum sp. NIES-4074]|nr:hypothetical protein NIES4074_25700 [Cylindrospermum sp. NIES-4074]